MEQSPCMPFGRNKVRLAVSVDQPHELVSLSWHLGQQLSWKRHSKSKHNAALKITRNGCNARSLDLLQAERGGGG